MNTTSVPSRIVIILLLFRTVFLLNCNSVTMQVIWRLKGTQSKMESGCTPSSLVGSTLSSSYFYPALIPLPFLDCHIGEIRLVFIGLASFSNMHLTFLLVSSWLRSSLIFILFAYLSAWNTCMPEVCSSVRFPGSGVTGSCELPDMGAENGTWILCKSSKYS